MPHKLQKKIQKIYNIYYREESKAGEVSKIIAKTFNKNIESTIKQFTKTDVFV